MKGLTMRLRNKSKDILRQMKMKTQQHKTYGKSNLKRKIHSHTGLPQETRNLSNKQSINFALKGTEGKRKTRRKRKTEERK